MTATRKGFFARIAAAASAFVAGSNVIITQQNNTVVAKTIPTGTTSNPKSRTNVNVPGHLTISQVMSLHSLYLQRQILWAGTASIIFRAFKLFVAGSKKDVPEENTAQLDLAMKQLASLAIARINVDNPIDFAHDKNIWMVSNLAPKTMNPQAAAIYAEINGCEVDELIGESMAKRGAAMKGLSQVLHDFLNFAQHSIASYSITADELEDDNEDSENTQWGFHGTGAEVNIPMSKVLNALNNVTKFLGEQNPEWAAAELLLLRGDWTDIERLAKKNARIEEAQAPDYVLTLDEKLATDDMLRAGMSSGK